MVLINDSWKVVAFATRTPGAANVTYQLLARINPQYHSIELNRDYVEIQVTYTMNSGYIYSGTWNFSATGCSDVSGGGTLSGSGTLMSGGFWAYHDNHGKYSTSVNAKLEFYFNAANAYLEASIELPDIPRVSVPSWKNGKNRVKMDGSDTITLILDKKVAAYRHSLVWVIGDSGYKWLNTNNIDTEYTFKPNEEMLKYSTDEKYVYGYLAVGTYTSGDPNATMLGAMNIGFFIDLPADSYAPVIKSSNVKEIGNNKIPEDKVFRYLSKKKLTMQAETRGYATVKSVYVSHNKQKFPMTLKEGTYSTDLEGLIDGDIQFVIEDSRGFKTVQDWRGAYVPYFYPTIAELKATRDNPTSSHGYMTASGKWFNGQSNTLTAVTQHIDSESLSTGLTLNGNDFSVNKEFNDLNYRNKFTFKLTVTDYYGQAVTREYILPGSQWTALFGKFTSLFRMIHVKKTPNMPCGIYNEGDLSVEGITYLKGGLVFSKEQPYSIVKEFTAQHTSLPSYQATYTNIPFTIPEGYEVQKIYASSCREALATEIKGISGANIVVHVANYFPGWTAPSGTVSVFVEFVRKAV